MRILIIFFWLNVIPCCVILNNSLELKFFIFFFMNDFSFRFYFFIYRRHVYFFLLCWEKYDLSPRYRTIRHCVIVHKLWKHFSTRLDITFLYFLHYFLFHIFFKLSVVELQADLSFVSIKILSSISILCLLIWRKLL